MQRLQDRVALVTGGAYGIGRAAALALAREGAKVVVSDVVDSGGEETVGLIRKAGGTARAFVADVSNTHDVEALVGKTLDNFKRLDIAFNNAGIEGKQLPLSDLGDDDWNKVLAVNLTGVFRCMRAELKQMLKQRYGSIVNNASVLGQVGFAGSGAYVAAKHAVLGLTKTAALEASAQGVRVNAICPGFIATPMLERAGLMKDPALLKGLEAVHAVKRLGRSEEVAQAVVFLASDEASFVTGAPFLVDGGYCAQ